MTSTPTMVPIVVNSCMQVDKTMFTVSYVIHMYEAILKNTQKFTNLCMFGLLSHFLEWFLLSTSRSAIMPTTCVILLALGIMHGSH